MFFSWTSLCIAAEDPFLAGVRPTEALSPADEQKSFHLPPGFAIDLVAAEPQIQKPMNLAFDAKGRLWLTDSVEYPYAAPLDKPGRDTIKVLEDTDGDGSFDKVTTFADGLNIPIGVYPYKNGAVAYSIPNIYWFEDADGDGKAEKREVLYGPLGWERDTHGMNNAFRRGFDGWLYACHGFNNETTIKGKDGSEIKMNSGNTYRIRLDGSRVEQFTWGQVNPFGMAIDPRGDIFTADCHSKPITLLLRGGYYESFGKPHDGLGFVPPVMDHLHGSTAIAGVAVYAAENFPPEYRGNLFTGNVMTSRVNRDVIEWRGSTAVAKELPDFLSTDDPWFRPVDIILGPDGALYVADFYNKIIGHYEVPLEHPGRDRHRGRIWRVSYRGEAAANPKKETKPKAAPIPNLSLASKEELVAALGSTNLTVRMLATSELTDRIGVAAADAVAVAVKTSKSATVRAHGLWILHRLGRLTEHALLAATGDQDGLVRTHAQRILSETPMWNDYLKNAVLACALTDADQFAQRAAADALGRHAEKEVVGPLLAHLVIVPSDDKYLRQTFRMTVRNQLRTPGLLSSFTKIDLQKETEAELADIVLGLPTPDAGEFLVGYVKTHELGRDKLIASLSHAAKHLPKSELDSLAELAQSKVGDELELQLSLLTAVTQGIRQQGVEPTATIKSWGERLANRLFTSSDETDAGWKPMPLEGANNPAIPWGLEPRRFADGAPAASFLSSLPSGEQLTGVIRSKPFALPEKLSLWIAGHMGYPDKRENKKNLVRIRLAGTGEILAIAYPPRNDTAQKTEFALEKHAGKEGYIEVVDGDSGNAYAWLAVARFEPAVAAVPSTAPSQVARRRQAAAQVAESLHLVSFRPRLEEMLLGAKSDPAARESAAKALLAFDADPILGALSRILADASVSELIRDRLARAIVERSDNDRAELVADTMKNVPQVQQLILAYELAGSAPGSEMLLALIEKGVVSARVLRTLAVSNRIKAAKPKDAELRIDAATASLPPLKEEIQTLINDRRQGFARAKTSLERGAKLFEKHCQACHQIAGKGTLIGPQLDGIGNRGKERLLEDVLDPNRNVDVAFRTTTYALTNGQIVVGLFRRQEGETVIVADSTGKELRFQSDEIESKTPSTTSLMAENWGTVLTPDEFYDVMAYLAAQTREAPKAVGGSGQ